MPDGNTEFLERQINKVKIRGFRIELGEVKAVLSQHQDVEETVVVAHEDRPKDKRIVAYVVLMRQKHADANHELHRFLK